MKKDDLLSCSPLLQRRQGVFHAKTQRIEEILLILGRFWGGQVSRVAHVEDLFYEYIHSFL
jgi:hypothetical protein